jgi:hypothetical protein
MAQESQTERTQGVTLLLIALMGALLFHGALSLYGTYRYTYDAYVHIFFADHWTRSWFDPWEPRWYTGFTLVSYPPLSQQSVALLSFVTGDLRTAFAIVQTAAMLSLTLGMYRFARLWVSDEAAGWAAIWLVFSSAMAETVHVFGQLPTTFSLGLLLNALPFAFRWIDRGRFPDLIRAWALIAATTGGHHVTTLFGSVFITAPVIVLALLGHFRRPLADEPGAHPQYVTWRNGRALVARRLRRILPAVTRSGVFGVGTILLLLIVVLPYWIWSRSDPITQMPIPHASRDNFLINTSAGLVFWLIPYGMLLFVFPYAFIRGFFSKAWPLTASIALLAVLGTGGTTPIPRLLLRGAFDVLTLDRFTLWASILMLPLAGQFVVSLRRGAIAAWIREQFGHLTWRSVQAFFAVGLILAAIFTVSLTQFRRFQPDPIDMQPILNFLEKDQHWRWRYLTLGFGDQMAWLSAQTTALQVDGNYHSARRLPELTTTPVERLEGAKFRGIPGIGSLQQFLAVPEKFNLKYIFSNDQFYDPLLFFYGWHRVQTLENGIVIWEREDIPVLPEVLPRREIPLVQRMIFGVLPPLALFCAILFATAPFWSLPLRLLAEVTGLRLRRPRLSILPGRRWWIAADHWLLDASRLPPNGGDDKSAWQIWLHDWWRRFRLRMDPASAEARHLRSMLLALALIVILGAGIARWLAHQRDPQQILLAYYDDLDFRRFGQAYSRLNPHTRPDFEQYMLNLSVQGGLVASYAKLETLETTLIVDLPRHKQMRVDARYITALSYYDDSQILTLDWLPEDGWVIEPDAADLRVPPDQFLRRTEVNYLSQGQRQVNSTTASFAGTPDRPDLAILSADLVVDREGRFSLVGEVMNIDADPGDLTVTGQIYDVEGNLLTWYNAGEAMMHKLLPLEITPFRIDFEGVAGLALEDAGKAISFTPGASWDYQPPPGSQLGDYTVFAKAVVTGRDLDRDVGVQHLRILESPDGLRVSGELINDGLTEAVIPHLLITLYDEEGKVIWVENAFLRQSVRPQRTLGFDLPLTPAADLQSVGLRGSALPTILPDGFAPTGVRTDFVPIPPGHGYAYARVSVNYFTGGAP